MPALLTVLAHHSEPTDPALLEGLLTRAEHALGGAWPVVVGLGALGVAVFAVGLVVLARRARSGLGR
ncbi:MAG: hypothetical protein VW450_03700 [Chloroflexota bacterium]